MVSHSSIKLVKDDNACIVLHSGIKLVKDDNACMVLHSSIKLVKDDNVCMGPQWKYWCCQLNLLELISVKLLNVVCKAS